jgi:hypothetical protein
MIQKQHKYKQCIFIFWCCNDDATTIPRHKNRDVEGLCMLSKEFTKEFKATIILQTQIVVMELLNTSVMLLKGQSTQVWSFVEQCVYRALRYNFECCDSKSECHFETKLY